MTKDEFRWLDLLIAKSYGEIVDSTFQNTYSLRKNIFYIHEQDGVLLGEPYKYKDLYFYTWYRYEPSTNIATAMNLFDLLMSFNKHWCPSLSWDDKDGLSIGNWVSTVYYYGEDENQYCEFYGEGDTKQLAVCEMFINLFNAHRDFRKNWKE